MNTADPLTAHIRAARIRDAIKTAMADPRIRQKMRDTHEKRGVISVDIKTQEVKTYSGTRSAAAHGYASSNIVACAKGRRPHSYGKLWCYTDEFTTIEALVERAKQMKMDGTRRHKDEIAA